MPWIETILPEDAAGVLREAYDWQAARLGAPTDFTQLGSLYPELVLERLRLYRAVESVPSVLAPAERYQAALVTSLANETVHCGSGLYLRLEELGVSPAAAEAFASGETPSGVDERLAAILGYAARLTRSPGEVSAAEVAALRRVGLSDVDILDLNNLVAYYNYINRVANGLGLRTPIEDRSEALHAVPVGADPRG